MFKPARMTRVLLGGHKDHLDATIGLLHNERLVHMEDYVDPTGTTTIGTPLERGDEASHLLVRVRGIIKAVGAEGSVVKAFAGEPNKALAEIEAGIQPALDGLAGARNEAARIESEVAALSPLAGLDLDMTGMSDVRSVRTYLGTVRQAPALTGISHETIVHGNAIAVIVGAADAKAAESALSAAGFSAIQLPADVSGTPRDALAVRSAAHRDAVASVVQAKSVLSGARDEWGDRLAALEAHLSAEVDRTQAPLKMGVTGTTFHVEGWIPAEKANRLENALSAKLGDAVYFESLGDAPRAHEAAPHGDAGHHHHEHEGHDHADAHHSTAEDEAPVHLTNKGLAKPYEFMLGLLGRPRYWELDPTKLMLIFFPLFFGLMVGDVLVGLAIMAFGFYLKKNHVFGIGGPSVGRALMMGGFVAVIAGGFVFGEALGIHFTVSDEALAEGEHSWEEIIYGTHMVDGHPVLNAEFPHEGFVYKHVSGGHGATDAMLHGHATDPHAAAPNATSELHMALAAESTEQHGGNGGFTAILKPHGTTHLSVNGWVNLGYYSKIHDIQALLAWCIIIAAVHLNLAFVLGIRNVAVGHGAVLAIQEKLSWITAQAGLGIAVWGGAFHGPEYAVALGIGIFVASIALLWRGVEKALGAPGFVAILEFLGFFGNVLSYTRLAAIGASKAGMALAFAAIGFEVVGGGNIHSIAGWIVYLIGMVLITALAMLSGGLQSLRLQFVEFFGKFYEGGGRAYKPFGRRNP